MSDNPPLQSAPTVGLLGFGAFGRLIASHLAPHLPLVIHDPRHPPDIPLPAGARSGTLAAAGSCDIVILAVPIGHLAEVLTRLAPHLRPGSTVVDVGSVKIEPVRLMRELLPPDVNIVGTHPLFGPQSAADGIRGHNIAVCPVRGRAAFRIAAFLGRRFGLKVHITTPEAHDAEAAVVQGLTHLIAKVLVGMDPLPTRLTTASYTKLVEATDMVRHDAASVFEAIERHNPFAAEVRRRFFTIADALRAELDSADANGDDRGKPPHTA